MIEDISIGKLVEWVRRFEDYTSTSLPQYTKRCLVSSRVYIQNEIAGEEIVSDVLKTLQNIYIGYILTAMQMNTYVVGNRTIRDMMSVVATEGFVGDDYIGIESFGADFNKTFNKGIVMAQPPFPLARPDSSRDDYTQDGVAGQRMTKMDKNEYTYPSGRLVELTFGADNGSGGQRTFSINVFVQLLPRILPSEVMEQFVSLNFERSITKRWLQYQAGEITFWGDFVAQLDLLKKRRIALKKDTTGDLKNLMDLQQNALIRQLLKLTGIMPDMQNIANSIMILEASSFDKFCNNNHIDFKRYDSRQNFFGKSFAMALITIDPMYNRITMYMNGLEAKSEYTFAQLVSAGKRENMNLVTLMSQMSQGQAPRF